jgi:methyl-accepting chemotaxis protein
MSDGGDRAIEQRLTELEARLEEMDDIVAQRCLAVLDVADELHRQINDRVDRLALQIDRNALAIAQNNLAIGQLTASVQQLVTNANADRAIMLQILQYLQNQYPGNGKREGEA